MMDVIEGQGYTVLTASNGVEAMDIVLNQHPDLILLDVVMPDKDGFGVCRDIKKNPTTKDVKVVMVTSKNQETDKFWGMKQGADEFITKPYEPQQILDAVARLI